MSASELAGMRGPPEVAPRAARVRGVFHKLTVIALVFVLVGGAAFALGLFSAAPAAPSGVSAQASLAHAAASAMRSANDTNASNGWNIFDDIWDLFSSFFGIVMVGLGNAFSTIFGAFGNGIADMFSGWGFALGGYGVWGPLMVVASLGVAAFVAYLILDAIGIEKDLAAGEDEVG